MIVELQLWQLITLLLAFFGACTGAGKVLLGQAQKHLDERFVAMEATRKSNHDANQSNLDLLGRRLENQGNDWQRLEREFLNLKADMPMHYVRREDYIRGQSIIEAKLDGLAMKLETVQLQVAANGKP